METKTLFIFLLSLHGHLTLPLETELSAESALQYLIEFGHIEPLSNNTTQASQSLQQIYKNFQEYVGLPQTGELDKDTVQLIKSPRCGVKDDVQSSRKHGKWPKRELTYQVVKYSKKLDKKIIDRICREAMDIWEEAADIKFKEKDSGPVRADIEILFSTKKHVTAEPRCDKPFDGPGGGSVLAHAFYPEHPTCPSNYAGDIHIDDDEDWSDYSDTFNAGIDLLHTVTHEVGHSLGLGHSSGKNAAKAIMYSHHPHTWVRPLKLHKDDVNQIQKLYGPPTTPSTPEPRPTPPTTRKPRIPKPPTPSTTRKPRILKQPTPSNSNKSCTCDRPRCDRLRNKTVGDCKNKWCYIKKNADCSDAKSNHLERWSPVEACKNMDKLFTQEPCKNI